jgi:pilus assembly protein CpaC
VLDFDILPNAQMIRVLGRRVGVTDLSVVSATGKAYSFEIRVVYDLALLRAYIKQLFPSADLNMVQMYEHVVVEGEAASTDQSLQIIDAISAYLTSVQVEHESESKSSIDPNAPAQQAPSSTPDDASNPDQPAPVPFQGGADEKPDVSASISPPQIINLIRVPGVQQIMLQVKIAEVNRTALRKMGTSWLYQDSKGRTFGSLLGSGTSDGGGGGGDSFLGLALGSATTAFAILPNTSFAAAFDALRLNNVISILAEPNLMAMHGQKASFLAGGEFPIPVFQNTTGGVGGGITIEYKDFGVLLDFVPYIMDNGTIRLKVAPEVSTIDPTLTVTAAGGGTAFGLNVRRANTTVELRQGQTLAIGGLLQAELRADTSRLPGMGDLPYIGPFFSNNSHERVEKELVILVTPHFVEPMEPDQVGPLPGCEIRDPDDKEFYALNRIESRHPTNNYRATNGWDDPLGHREKKNDPSRKGLFGVFGFSK